MNVDKPKRRFNDLFRESVIILFHEFGSEFLVRHVSSPKLFKQYVCDVDGLRYGLRRMPVSVVLESPSTSKRLNTEAELIIVCTIRRMTKKYRINQFWLLVIRKHTCNCITRLFNLYVYRITLNVTIYYRLQLCM